MPRFIPGIAAPAAICLCLLVTCCGPRDTHEQIMDDTLGLMEQLAGFLEKARDASSASQAVDGIKNLVPEFDKIADRSRAVGKPSGEMARDLQKKFDQRRTRVLQRSDCSPSTSPASTLACRCEDAPVLLPSLLAPIRSGLFASLGNPSRYRPRTCFRSSQPGLHDCGRLHLS